MLKVTVKGLFAHKIRFALTALAVVLGVAFLAGTLVLTDTVGKAFDDLFADINEGTDVVVRRVEPFEAQFGLDTRPRIDNEYVAEVEAVDGVEAAEGQVGGFALIVDDEGEPIGAGEQGPPQLGFSWSVVPELNPVELVAGDPPAGPDEVVVDRGSSKEADLEVGDSVSILTQAGLNDFTVSGIVTFGGADSALGATMSIFEAPRAQELMAEPGQWDEIRAVAASGVSQSELADRVASSIGAGQGDRSDIEVLTGDELTRETQADVADQLSFFDYFLLAFALIALFVGFFIIKNTFSIVVIQRTREMALLRAVGASRVQVLGSVIGEALLLSLAASVVGIAAGVLLAQGLVVLLDAVGLDIPTTSTVIAASTVVWSLVAGVGITILSATWPAIRASRTAPVEALRDIDTETRGQSVARAISGVAVIVLGLVMVFVGLFGDVELPLLSSALLQVLAGAVVVFVGVTIFGPIIAGPGAHVLGAPLPRIRGVAGRLARENAKRNPRRTAATAAALMIGVGIVGFIAIAADSAKASINDVIDRAFRADFVIDSQTFGFGGFSTDVAEALREIEGIEAVSPLRFGAAQYRGSSTFVDGVDPESINILFDVGVTEGQIEGMGPNDVAMYSGKVEDEGLALGDTVTLIFGDTGAQDFTLAAIYDEPEPADDFTISLDAFEQNFADVFDSQLYVKYPDGTDLESVRPELERVVSEVAPNAEVQDQAEFRDSIAGQINQLLNIIFALLFLAIIIALIGIANALALAVFERTHEIGLLRAVGMSRRQVRSTVRWEAVIVALLGTVLGLVVSLVFGWLLVKSLEEEGFEVFSIPLGQMVAILVLAAFAGVIAAIGPARRAAKLDVLRAIATE